MISETRDIARPETMPDPPAYITYRENCIAGFTGVPFGMSPPFAAQAPPKKSPKEKSANTRPAGMPKAIRMVEFLFCMAN